MPYLKIQTNITLNDSFKKDFLIKCSNLLVDKLHKPERTVMVVFEEQQTMFYAGSYNPVAFLELKSIGLLETQTQNLSQSLCNLIELELEISPDRIYIEFDTISASMWGWNGTTFKVDL